MLSQIVSSLFIAVFFFAVYKIGQVFVPKENPISKVLTVGSIVLGTFLIGLILTA
ncbi:MAG: hypothetical protein RBT59_00985 [Arcobacteraceae bacterium]|jgi:Ca2+/Na+ antiporter|nr:hypothetical protein [Arcobacteraceae bacterium]